MTTDLPVYLVSHLLVGGTTPTTTRTPAPDVPSPYYTAEQAAAYLRIAYSTFRKRATRITRCPQTRRYHKDDLDLFAKSLRPSVNVEPSRTVSPGDCGEEQ